MGLYSKDRIGGHIAAFNNSPKHLANRSPISLLRCKSQTVDLAWGNRRSTRRNPLNYVIPPLLAKFGGVFVKPLDPAGGNGNDKE
jgi:hypothetical protein